MTAYDANKSIAKEFLVAGPYGDGVDEAKVTASAGLLDINYIGEDEFAKTTADDVPFPGDYAPNADRIKPPSADELALVPNPANGIPAKPQIITRWRQGDIDFVNSGTFAVVKMLSPKNYAWEYPARTTYGVTFVFVDQDYKDITMTQLIDDVGAVWINGQLVRPKDTTGSNNTTETRTVTLLRGINYIVVRDTNVNKSTSNTSWDGGGMKFGISFSVPVSASPIL
jgi:hypothetical protein